MRGIPFRVIPIQDRPFNDLHLQSGPLWPLRSLWPLWPCWPYGALGSLGSLTSGQAHQQTQKDECLSFHQRFTPRQKVGWVPVAERDVTSGTNKTPQNYTVKGNPVSPPLANYGPRGIHRLGQ